MKKYSQACALFLVFAACTSLQGQNKAERPTGAIKIKTKGVTISRGPTTVTRNIIQDRKGNIWMAAFDGVFRFDGKSFTNFTNKVSAARFMSVFQDRTGKLWFGSIGSGVFRFDGRSFKNFTIREGLLNDEIICINEDRAGNIWFGVNGGASCYDGKSFRNYMINGDSMMEVSKGVTFPDMTRPPNEVMSIAEDKNGRFWFGTRGKTFVYDGKKFTVLIHDGKSFTNFRSIIADKKGNIWLGGGNVGSGWEGLWRYDGITFTNFTRDFVDCVYEDKKGNIWANSLKANDREWVLSRYDEKSLSNVKPTLTQIKSGYTVDRGMVFSILVAYDGNIWLGVMGGVRRYDGKVIGH